MEVALSVPPSRPPTNSSNELKLSLAACKGAQQLIKLCRVRKDIGDVAQFVVAIAYVLNGYAAEIIQQVTDPVRGLPGRLRYPLEISDVARACKDAHTIMLLDRSRALYQPPPSQVWIRADSPQWKAWTKHRGTTFPTDKDGGWHVDSEWPPEAPPPPPPKPKKPPLQNLDELLAKARGKCVI